MFAAVFAAVVAGAEVAGAQADPDPRQRELEAIRAEIARLEARLEAVEARESTLEDRLRRVRMELELQQTRLREATTALELAAARVLATEARVEELEAALEAVRGDLQRRLGGLYRLGRGGYLRLFLALRRDAGRTDENLLPAIRQLRFLARRDQLALERFRATRDQLADQRRRLAAERREAAAWQESESRRHDELAALGRRHEELLAELEAQRRDLTAQADELQDKERKLGRLIASLVGDSPAPLAGTSIEEFRGALDWPVAGEVAAGFGPRRDPRYRTEVPHNGLDIAAAAGSEVRVIFPGRVLYAAQFEGYGTMVVVYHPGGAFTLYAGLVELSVAKDDMLALGDVLGTAAGLLYFEIRLDNRPQDPHRWLR